MFTDPDEHIYQQWQKEHEKINPDRINPYLHPKWPKHSNHSIQRGNTHGISHTRNTRPGAANKGATEKGGISIREILKNKQTENGKQQRAKTQEP